MIQFRGNKEHQWNDFRDVYCFTLTCHNEHFEWRIKPEPMEFWQYVWFTKDKQCFSDMFPNKIFADENKDIYPKEAVLIHYREVIE